VRRALEEPIRRIVENASLEGSVVVEKVKAASTPTQGFDAERNEYLDLMKAGIVDATKVEWIALQNAASIASDDRGADHGHPSEGASHTGRAARWWHGRHGRRLLTRRREHPATPTASRGHPASGAVWCRCRSRCVDRRRRPTGNWKRTSRLTAASELRSGAEEFQSGQPSEIRGDRHP
jgi:hypothetical protein